MPRCFLTHTRLRARELRPARSLYVTSNQHGGQGDFGIAPVAIFKPLLYHFCMSSARFLVWPLSELVFAVLCGEGVGGCGDSEPVASLRQSALALMRHLQPRKLAR